MEGGASWSDVVLAGVPADWGPAESTVQVSERDARFRVWDLGVRAHKRFRYP